IFAYLRTVPPIKNAVPRTALAVVASTDTGQAAYYKYGCNSCHGDTGVGLYDLRKGPTDFPTDEALIAYIRHPAVAQPGGRMPTGDGAMAETDYAPLVAPAGSLAAKK